MEKLIRRNIIYDQELTGLELRMRKVGTWKLNHRLAKFDLQRKNISAKRKYKHQKTKGKENTNMLQTKGVVTDGGEPPAPEANFN